MHRRWVAGLGALGVIALLVACGSASTTTSSPARRAARTPCDPVMGAGHCAETTRQAICDYAADAGTFAGSLVAKQGAVATFRVVSIRSRRVGPTARHLPVTGRPIAVHYENGDERFLKVGDEYAVRVWWLGASAEPRHFFSSVHTDAHVCSGGTIHADGTAIDTR